MSPSSRSTDRSHDTSHSTSASRKTRQGLFEMSASSFLLQEAPVRANEDFCDRIHWLRNTLPYINAHRGRTFVLQMSGDAIEHSNFANVLYDIALLHSLGVRLVIVHGARAQIEERLNKYGVSSVFHKNIRITDADTVPHVRDATGMLRCRFEALLSMGLPNSPMAGAHLRVCSGNFLTAKPIGVMDGVDHHFTGTVRRVDVSGIEQQLEDGSLVLQSPIGYSPSGETFFLETFDAAVSVAIAIRADKLILMDKTAIVSADSGLLVRQCRASDIATLKTLASDQEPLLSTAYRACTGGVSRCHIVSYADDGALLQELLSHDGSGTLVANNDYEHSRMATIDDIGGILELIQPLEQEGILRR